MKSLALCLTAATALAWSNASAQSAVTVQNAWARATPPGVPTGAVYFSLTSPVADKLVSASTPAAAEASVHSTAMADGVMRMRPVQGGLDLPAGKPVTLKPGGFHLMLEGLKAPLHAGGTIPIHLVFQNAAPVDAEAKVMPVGSAGPGAPQAGMAGMKMDQ